MVEALNKDELANLNARFNDLINAIKLMREDDDCSEDQFDEMVDQLKVEHREGMEQVANAKLTRAKAELEANFKKELAKKLRDKKWEVIEFLNADKLLYEIGAPRQKGRFQEELMKRIIAGVPDGDTSG